MTLDQFPISVPSFKKKKRLRFFSLSSVVHKSAIINETVKKKITVKVGYWLNFYYMTMEKEMLRFKLVQGESN